MESERRPVTGWIVGVVVLAAIIGLLVFARGPSDQDRSGAAAPAAVLSAQRS